MTEYLPKPYTSFRDTYPEVAAALDGLGAAVDAAGSLDERHGEGSEKVLKSRARLKLSTFGIDGPATATRVGAVYRYRMIHCVDADRYHPHLR